MYQTLYRKYRPKSFDDVIGQDVVVRTLKNSIKNDKISHAYMFFGPRGIGKTSVAKIFARTINCAKKDGNLCGKCDMCQITSSKECLDIIEIDAASNNGVDEIRELRDKVSLVPSQLKYKIYIIDEVHMLTIQAFNALLKTLEEPPSHIIFILATTDPQKVPETIVSRCQCFSFERIRNNDIVFNLKKICTQESISISDEVLNKIAIMSNGGMRDSIGMLEKLYSYCEDNITLKDFYELNKIISDDEIFDFIKMINDCKMTEVVNIVDLWNQNGINIVQLVELILYSLKDIILKSLTEKNYKLFDVEKLIVLTNILNEKMFDLKKCSNPSISFQIILLDYMNKYKNISREIITNVKEVGNQTKSDINNEEVIIQKDKKESNDFEKNISSSECVVKDINQSNIDEIINIRLNNTFSLADKNELLNDKKSFNKLNDFTFDQNIGYLVCILLDGEIRVSSKENIVLSYEYDSVVRENLNYLQELSDVLKNILNINKKVVILSNERWENEKRKFITKLKNNEKYQYAKEPDLVFYNDNEIDEYSSVIEDFGDIVEIE